MENVVNIENWCDVITTHTRTRLQLNYNSFSIFLHKKLILKMLDSEFEGGNTELNKNKTK